MWLRLRPGAGILNETNEVRQRRRPAPAWIAPIGAASAAAIALVALARRAYEAGAAASVPPIGTAMLPATATGLLLAAAALWLLRAPQGERTRRVGYVLAAATTALGLTVIGQHVVDWANGLEPGGLIDDGGRWLRRPSFTTGLGLMLAGASLLALGVRTRRVRRWAGVGAAATLIVALAGLIGHAYDASELYGGGTAVSAAVALIALAIGVLFADPSRGVAAISTSGSAGGQLLRRLTPAAVLAPFALGWLALEAHEKGFVDAPFSAAVLVASLIVLLVGLIIGQAAALHRVDRERERLLAGERDASEQVTQILESITDAFFAVDREWRFTYINSEAERLLQRSRAELLGQGLWDEFPDARGTTFEREYGRAMNERTTARFEAYYPAPLDAWFDVRAFPTADGLSVYFTNITARKQAEERLRESEERYRLLADMIPQHIWTTDANGYHTYFSRRWYEFTGVSPEESRGEGWSHLLHPDDRERTIAVWQHSLRTGQPYSIEYRFRKHTGEYCWFLGQAVPLRNQSDEIVEWFGTLTDISETKGLEQEREGLLTREQEARAEAERRREALERVTESRTRLMRGFSHDLKNPLGAADGHAALLEDGLLGELSDKQRESIQRIRRSIHTSLRLIDDLLELARAEAGQIRVARVATDVAQVAREVADDFRAQAKTVGLEIEVHGGDGLRAETDPTRLRQILANLLSNAVKYAPQGRVDVDAQATSNGGGPAPGAWIAVSVTDTGPGIPEEKREVIFQEFTRLDPHAQSGAGVGLAISRRIAQLMGGELTVESEVGRGSTFTLWLPPEGGRDASASE